jgi:hypothetical protein
VSHSFPLVLFYCPSSPPCLPVLTLPQDENPRKKGKGRKPKAPPAPALEADASYVCPAACDRLLLFTDNPFSDVADEASLKKRKGKPKSKTKAHGAAKKYVLYLPIPQLLPNHPRHRRPHVKSTSASKTTSAGRRSGKSQYVFLLYPFLSNLTVSSSRTADINDAEDDKYVAAPSLF